jgi:histidinol-phosphate aminotransferase
MFDLEKAVRPSIRNLVPYTSARDEFVGKAEVYLDANENPYGVLNRYPDPYQNQLKNNLSLTKNIPAEYIFISNGSDEIIDLTLRIFCQPGVDKALTFTPTYGMYQVSAAINQVELIQLPLDDNFQIDSTSLEKYYQDDQLKLIFICSPNNPTGNLISIHTIESILQQFNGIVLIDEAYIDFSMSASWIEKIHQYPNLIVSQTFSKAWGLAAARVGVAYANPNLMSWYNKVKPPYNVSQINQEAALLALNNKVHYEAKISAILKQKRILLKALLPLAFIQKIYPSEANFIFIQVKDANKIYRTLVQQKIIVRNRHQLVANSLRISIGTPAENQKLITALQNIPL